MIRYASYGYPMPVQLPDGTWDAGEADSVQAGEWGEFRVEIGAVWDISTDPPTKTADGVDITSIVDTRSLIDALGFAEPWGETIGSIRLPRLTPFDAPDWLRELANIDVWRVLPADLARQLGRTEVGYWHGFVASIELGDGPGMASSVSLQLAGAGLGECTLRCHQPQLRDRVLDAGQWIARAMSVQDFPRPFTPFVGFRFESDDTNIDLRYRGSRGSNVAEYVEQVLEQAQSPTVAWTISRAFDEDGYVQPRKYYLRQVSDELDGAVQQNTVFLGGDGVTLLGFTKDGTEAVNAVYGEGLDPKDGSRWRNMKHPALFPAKPDYPDRTDGPTYPLGYGDDDSMFAEDSITQLQYGLRFGAWPDVEITGEWGDDTTTAVRALQEDAGVTVTGTIEDNDGWDLVWENTALISDLDASYARPLSEVTESSKYLYSPTGQVIAENDAYDGRIRVERAISYEDVGKERARLHARRLARQAIDGASWTGRVVLTSDPTDENGNGRSRLDIREGGWLRINGMDGGSLADFYIAGKQDSDEGHTVTLTVSQKPRPFMDLVTQQARIRAVKEDPTRALYLRRGRTRNPWKESTGWDKESGAGIVRPTVLAAGWNVIKFVGAERGTIDSIRARTSSDPEPFVLAIFGKDFSTETDTMVDLLTDLIPDPMAEEPDGYGWWSLDTTVDTLDSWYFVESWGEFEQRAGYSPGAETSKKPDADPHPVTGRLVDALGWRFGSDDAPYLWAAVYVETACTFRATMRIVVEE